MNVADAKNGTYGCVQIRASGRFLRHYNGQNGAARVALFRSIGGRMRVLCGVVAILAATMAMQPHGQKMTPPIPAGAGESYGHIPAASAVSNFAVKP